MTINNVGSSYASSAAAFQSFEGRVTALIVSTEATEQRADQQLLNQARQNFVEESKEEVAAMHAEAEAMRDGAGVKLAVALVGIGVQGVVLAGEVKAFAPTGSSSDTERLLSGVGQTIANQGPGIAGGFYESEARQHQADAKGASYSAEQARWELNDRREGIANSRNEQRQATEWLSQSVSSEAASTNAILSNMA